jgi:hypothetical protein
LTSALDNKRLHKDHFLLIVIINLDNQPGLLVRDIRYFAFDLVNDPGVKNINALILGRIILLELEYSSHNQVIDLLFLRYLK